jgi:hypothetical protein
MTWLREHPELGIIIAFLGLVLTYLGIASGQHWPPFSSSSSPSPTTTPAPGAKNPGQTSTSTAAISPPPTSPTPVSSFTSPVGITFSGIDFDSNPLGPGPNYINWQRYNYRLQGYGSSVIVSRYPSSGALPTEARCRSWAQAHNSQILDGVNRGDRLCFITQDQRTVRFIVTDITDSAVEGQATVWNDGNQ